MLINTNLENQNDSLVKRLLLLTDQITDKERYETFEDSLKVQNEQIVELKGLIVHKDDLAMQVEKTLKNLAFFQN